MIVGGDAAFGRNPPREGSEERRWFELVEDWFCDRKTGIDHTKGRFETGQKRDQRVLSSSISCGDVGCHFDPDESDNTNAIASISNLALKSRFEQRKGRIRARSFLRYTHRKYPAQSDLPFRRHLKPP